MCGDPVCASLSSFSFSAPRCLSRVYRRLYTVCTRLYVCMCVCVCVRAGDVPLSAQENGGLPLVSVSPPSFGSTPLGLSLLLFPPLKRAAVGTQHSQGTPWRVCRKQARIAFSRWPPFLLFRRCQSWQGDVEPGASALTPRLAPWSAFSCPTERRPRQSRAFLQPPPLSLSSRTGWSRAH